jgi:DNA-binding HxlR family transcriptional regulator
LTENLRELEDAGIVLRRDFGGAVRHVEYDFRDEVRPAIEAMLDNLAEFGGRMHTPRTETAK